MKQRLKIPGLWLLSSSGAVKIDHEGIVYCHHSNNITKIVYTCGRVTEVTVPLKTIEDKLCKKSFYRCHRNYLINLSLVGNCIQHDYTLSLHKCGSVPVSRRRRKKLRLVLEKFISDSNQADIEF